MRSIRPRVTTLAAIVFAASAIVATSQSLAVANSKPGGQPPPPPQPHVITQFANDLSGARRGPKSRPEPVPIGNDIDGCNHDYGEPGQCVPLNLPPGQADWCAYLSSHGMAHVKVNGRDSRGLDPRHTGSTCN